MYNCTHRNSVLYIYPNQRYRTPFSNYRHFTNKNHINSARKDNKQELYRSFTKEQPFSAPDRAAAAQTSDNSKVDSPLCETGDVTTPAAQWPSEDQQPTHSAEAATQTVQTNIHRAKPRRKRRSGVYKPAGTLPNGLLDYIEGDHAPNKDIPTWDIKSPRSMNNSQQINEHESAKGSGKNIVVSNKHVCTYNIDGALSPQVPQMNVNNEHIEGYVSYKCELIGNVTAGIYNICGNSGHVQFQIGNKTIPVLVDTGSSVTLCHQSRLDELDSNFIRYGPPPEHNESSALGVDDQPITFTKTCFITFNVQGHSFELRFLVSQDCGQNVFIIGRNSLQELKAIYDAGNGTLTIPKLPDKILYTVQNEYIPPNSEKVIELSKPTNFPTGATVLGITEKLHQNSSKLLTCLNVVSDYQQPVLLVRNKTNATINLRPNLAIAKFSPLSDYLDNDTTSALIDFSNPEHVAMCNALGSDACADRSMMIGARGVYTGPEQFEHSDMVNEDELFGGRTTSKTHQIAVIALINLTMITDIQI